MGRRNGYKADCDFGNRVWAQNQIVSEWICDRCGTVLQQQTPHELHVLVNDHINLEARR